MDIIQAISQDTYIKSLKEFLLIKLREVDYRNIENFYSILIAYIYDSYFLKYGKYNIYLYFANELLLFDDKYLIISQQEFDNYVSNCNTNLVLPPIINRCVSPKTNNVKKFPNLIYNNNKYIKRNKNKDDQNSVSIDQLIEKLINHIIDVGIVNNNIDPVKFYEYIQSYISPELVLESKDKNTEVAYKIIVFEKISEFFGINLPKSEIDFLVFDTVLEIGNICNYNFNDTHDVMMLITNMVENIITIPQNEKYKEFTGIIEIKVAKLIGELYNPKITADNIIDYKKKIMKDNNNNEKLDEEFDEEFDEEIIE